MLLLLVAMLVQSQPQAIATVRIQAAIFDTAEGRNAATRMDARWRPKAAALAKKESDLKNERAKLEAESKIRRGFWPFRHAMSAKRKAALEAALTAKARALRREREDDQADFDKERNRVLGDLGRKMRQVLERYAKDKGYTFVFDTSSPENPVVFGQNDITAEVVKVYNQTYPATP